jgi:hypothetical protein
MNRCRHIIYDHYLQMFRGFSLKNQAMSLRDLGNQKGFESALQETDRTFRTIQAEAELYLANAYTGLGSATLLKGQGKDALCWIDKALDLCRSTSTRSMTGRKC